MVGSSSSPQRWPAAIVFAALIFASGCSRLLRAYQQWDASRYDAQIRRAGDSIAASRSAAERSLAYADRADAYSEKARYLRLEKLVAIEDYNKLFDLALNDYGHALALAPDNTEIYYRRGNAYYSRAGLDMIYAPYVSDSLAPARADFSRVVEKTPNNAEALDMLGLTDSSMREWTAAIADFEREAALKPDMRFRVSDAYCNRGTSYPVEKYDLAISDLNQAIQIRGTSDPCECEPYNPLLAIYLNRTREYDKAQEVVALAKRSGKWIAPEYLEQLKTSSAGR